MIYINEYSELTTKLKADNIQLIRLERKNKLSALLSRYICDHLKIWQVTSPDISKNIQENLKSNKITININTLKKDLFFMVKAFRYKNIMFKEVPIIYFEDFENNPDEYLRFKFNVDKKFSTNSERFTKKPEQYFKNIDAIYRVYESYYNFFEINI